ncbi:hypothetical protein MTR67_041620 [Solanum verrucosum]|uniref:Uncharacterized protein n=1 Tax=Solanum verrucosum TaxID=315347 RepID=A0AAF0UL19_SOLVR|nr:hypothetical protein MTR67_041620 [Solanum verrucosum]
MSCGQSRGNSLPKVGKKYVQRVGDSLRRMVDHPTLLGQKENGLPKVGEKHLQRTGDNQMGTIYHQTLSGQKGKDQVKPGEELLLLNGWENQTQKVGPKESTTISMHLRLSGRKCRQEV